MRHGFVVVRTVALALMVFGLSTLVQAEDKSSGCGLGWQVTSKQSLLGSTTRNTTNVVLPSTFGMTSGTSGCAQHSIAKKDEPAVRYLFANYEPLTIQMAEGQGEYLNGFASSLGCSDLRTFGRTMQKNYRAIINEGKDTPFDVFNRVKVQVHQNPALSGNCSA